MHACLKRRPQPQRATNRNVRAAWQRAGCRQAKAPCGSAQASQCSQRRDARWHGAIEVVVSERPASRTRSILKSAFTGLYTLHRAGRAYRYFRLASVVIPGKGERRRFPPTSLCDAHE